MPDRFDLSIVAGSYTTARYSLTTLNGAGVVVAYDLTGAVVDVVARSDEDGTEVTYAEGSGVTVAVPRTTGVVTVRFDTDELASGSWSYEVRVSAGGDPDVSAYGSIVVVDVLDPILSALRQAIGSEVPPTDAQLLADYAKLGTVDAVVLAVLEARYVSMLTEPAKWAVQGGMSEDWSENLKALKERIGTIRDSTVAPATVSAADIDRTDSAWSR